MSDRENSPDAVGNSPERQSLEEKTTSAEGSPSQMEDRGGSRSRSRSHSLRRRRSYSSSRSHSRSGQRYKHHSRSRSHSRQRYSRSRSKSRSYSPRYDSPRRQYRDESYRYGGSGGGGGRYHRGGGRYSRPQYSSRRRHVGNRDNPEPSRCLGVFGLSLHTQERELRDVFGRYGPIEAVQVVYDAQSGRSRGFAFVYYEEVEDARMAKEKCNDTDIDGRKIRVDFSITKRAHTPTPGVYMGKPTNPKFGGHRDGYRGHSPSPYYSKRHHSRSRSRSYSPRKYSGYY